MKRSSTSDQVLHGIWRYSSRKPLWPSPKALVGAGGETKSTSWWEDNLERKENVLNIWIFRQRCCNIQLFVMLLRWCAMFKLHGNLQYGSCSRSRDRKDRARGRSRCQTWGSLALRFRCWLTIRVFKISKKFSPVVNPHWSPISASSCCGSACSVAPKLKNQHWHESWYQKARTMYHDRIHSHDQTELYVQDLFDLYLIVAVGTSESVWNEFVSAVDFQQTYL